MIATRPRPIDKISRPDVQKLGEARRDSLGAIGTFGPRDEMQTQLLARGLKTLERNGTNGEPVVERQLAQFDSALILVYIERIPVAACTTET